MCTLVGKGAAADPFLASTSDNPYSTRNFVRVETPKEGFRYIGTVVESLQGHVPWNGLITRGLNSQGFAFTYSYVEPAFVGVAPEVDPVSFSKRLIASCSSTEDGIRFLARGAPVGATGNYLLLDRTGRLAIVEVSTHGSAALVTDEAVRTNTWLAPNMPEYAHSVYSGESSKIRLKRAQHLLRRVSGAREAPAILNDHEHHKDPEENYGASICNHGLENGTVSSEIVMPTEGCFLYAYGRPCESGSQGFASWGRYWEFRLALTPDGPITNIDGSLVSPTESTSSTGGDRCVEGE
jgi:hypothetical protein